MQREIKRLQSEQRGESANSGKIAVMRMETRSARERKRAVMARSGMLKPVNAFPRPNAVKDAQMVRTWTHVRDAAALTSRLLMTFLNATKLRQARPALTQVSVKAVLGVRIVKVVNSRLTQRTLTTSPSDT